MKLVQEVVVEVVVILQTDRVQEGLVEEALAAIEKMV
jgi:hypothetical protein